MGQGGFAIWVAAGAVCVAGWPREEGDVGDRAVL